MPPALAVALTVTAVASVSAAVVVPQLAGRPTGPDTPQVVGAPSTTARPPADTTSATPSAAPAVAPPTPSCADYDSAEQAQAALDADPALAPLLDTDSDGRPCELRWPRTPVGQLAEDVGDAVEDVVDTLTGSCPDSGFDGVRPWVARAGHHLAGRFGVPITSIGGVAARARASEHPRGLALDFPVDRATGDDLAAYALEQAEELAVYYVIWRQRINFGAGWEPMEDRGSVTANHFDHVHISFDDTGDGTGLRC